MSHKLTAQIVRYCDILLFSLLRGSGLKFPKLLPISGEPVVLPLTREWIEIYSDKVSPHFLAVLPLTREWIEISQAK